METTENLKQATGSPLADAWAELQAHADRGEPLDPAAYRLAFADPEFMLRRETRGIRFQLELLKPDLELSAAGINHTVVVYGSARFVSREVAAERLAAARASGDAHAIALAERSERTSVYYEQAREFGQLVSQFGLTQPPKERLYICTGGGPGIMEAANRGAQEAGAPSVGLNITLPHEQSGNRYITPELSFKFHYFALRKMHFLMRAQALVVFPGGFGTMDELFEVLTLVQTRKVRRVPVVLVGRDFWTRLLHMDAMLEDATISQEDLELFKIVDTPQEAWEVIRGFYSL